MHNLTVALFQSIARHQRVLSQVDLLFKQQSDARKSASIPAFQFGGQQVVGLLRMIRDNAHSFHREPIGPVGSLLRLSDSK